MGHTNSTANLALPQFIGTDKPTWLGDINGAFSAIDSYAGTNDAAVSAATADASAAISQASSAVNTANTANTTAGNASTTANNALGVANTANAIAGTVDAKVGLLADLNTTDRSSIVNAINEVYSFGTTTTLKADSIAAGTNTNITLNGSLSSHSEVELAIAYAGAFLNIQSCRVSDFQTTGLTAFHYDGVNKVAVKIFYVDDTTVNIVSDANNTLTVGFEIVGLI